MNPRGLMHEVMMLKPDERFKLVEAILQSLDEPDKEIDQAWIEEAERRLAGYRSGSVGSTPYSELFKD